MQLNIGRYHSAYQLADKPILERHISPTAEQFYDLFGVGRDPKAVLLNKEGVNVNTPGLAPKDLAGVALMGIRELVTQSKGLGLQVDFDRDRSLTIFDWHEHRLNDQGTLLVEHDLAVTDHEARIAELEVENRRLSPNPPKV